MSGGNFRAPLKGDPAKPGLTAHIPAQLKRCLYRKIVLYNPFLYRQRSPHYINTFKKAIIKSRIKKNYTASKANRI